VIPGSVGHGEDLICSYSACRNAGVKFRYCAFCRVPVAKRNFHQRHGHGIPTTREEAQNNKSSGTVKRPSAPNPQPTVATNNRSGSKQNKKTPPTKTVGNSRLHSTDDLSRQSNKRDRDRYSIASNQKVSCSDPSGTSTSISKSVSPEIPHARQMQWASLLRRRPDTSDSDSMSAWLLQVMAISDLKAPLKTQGTSSLTTSNSSSELSSDTNEPTSSLNSCTSSDGSQSDGSLSSDVSSLEQDPRRSDGKKNRGQKRRIPEPPPRRNALAAGREEDDGDEERRRRKKKQRTLETEEGSARKKPKHKSLQKYKVSSSSKAYGNTSSSAKRHNSDTKEKKPERKSEKIGGNYAEWRESKKQKALSKKRKATSTGKS
jgi:hypothetical protein